MDLITLTQPLRDRRWFGYVFGLFAVLISLGVRIVLGDPALKFPFVIFIPAVVLTTFLGVRWARVKAPALSGVAPGWAATRTQDARLQERRIGAKISLGAGRRPEYLLRPTPSHLGTNAPGLSSSGDEHVALCRRRRLKMG